MVLFLKKKLKSRIAVIAVNKLLNLKLFEFLIKIQNRAKNLQISGIAMQPLKGVAGITIKADEGRNMNGRQRPRDGGGASGGNQGNDAKRVKPHRRRSKS